MSKPEISVIVLSHNTVDITLGCLRSLEKVRKEANFEVVVIDNGSIDQSVPMIIKKFPWVRLKVSSNNLGFAKGNNLAKKIVKGKYILFLNSDIEVHPGAISKTLNFLKENKDAGAVSCKLILKSGKLDPDTRRAFPTPWVSLTHLVLHLDKIFPNSRIFSKYWYGYIPENTTHEVDVIQGAFMLTYKSILDKIGWFDESYFLDGEDIDLCWKIKNLGYKIYYYPEVTTLHLKGVTKGKNKTLGKSVSFSQKLRFRLAGVNSMEIFYRKHMWNKYPILVNFMVLIGINIVKFFRALKTVVS